MPRQQEPKKDVVSCDKLRQVANERYSLGFPNGKTYLLEEQVLRREPDELKHLSNPRKRK